MTRLALALLTSFALAGCAGTYRVDNAVQSYAHWSADVPTGAPGAQAPAAVPKAPQTYRFERLPSQREGGSADDQNRLEAWTRTVLETHGWTVAEAPASAPWRVQVTATTVRNARSPWDDPWGGWHFRGQVVAGNGHFFWSPMFVVPMDMPWYERKVTVVVRDAVESLADGGHAHAELSRDLVLPQPFARLVLARDDLVVQNVEDVLFERAFLDELVFFDNRGTAGHLPPSRSG